MKKIVVSVLILFMLVGCGSHDAKKESIDITHKLGTTAVQTNPEKVVVFDMGLVDMMDAYELPVSGIPKASLTQALKQYEDEKYLNAGTLFEPDFEAIAGHKPDLIIVSGRSAKQYDELSKIAPTIYLGSDSSDEGLVASMKQNTEVLTKIFPKRSFAEKMTQLEQDIIHFKEKATQNDGTLMFVMANGNEIKAFGEKSRYDHVFSDFGFKAGDVAIEISNHGAMLSFELLAKLNPEMILIMDRSQVTGGEGNAKQLMDNDFVKQTQAYQNDHIIYVNPENWYLTEGGFTAVSSMLSELAPLIPNA